MAVDSASQPAPLGFDPDSRRERDREERDKRLRADGNAQYRHLGADLADFMDDPYLDPAFTREPLQDEVEVAVIGRGFSGLCTGARLRGAGVEGVRMIESGGSFGGTGYWNRYPGAQCDIESYLHLPLLEELGTLPSLKYVYASEIPAHAHAIAQHFDLYRDGCFETQVTEMRWDADAARWILSTHRDDAIRAQFVCLANGPLSRPKLPGIPGVEALHRHILHTSRWEYGYTGGDRNGNLTKLGDKRVGVIGTGATSVQCVPHLGEAAEHRYVFQRTPSSIDTRKNTLTDPAWAQSLEPGWQQKRIDNFSTLVSGGFAEEDLVSDGCTDIIRNLSGMAAKEGPGTTPEEVVRQVELADFQKMEQVRERVDSIMSDPETSEGLKPYDRQFCKRPCFRDDYLATFTRSNVTLVDTDGRGVERVTKRGVVVAGKESELDCLIYAMGFEVGTNYSRRAGCTILGRDGLTLTEKWKDGMETLQGLMSHGFPNCFLLRGQQSGVTPNFTELYNEQSRHIAYGVSESLSRKVEGVEASAEAEAEWVRGINESARGNEAFSPDCTPGYCNNEGKPGAGPSWFGGTYGGDALASFQLLKEWREQGELRSLTLG